MALEFRRVYDLELLVWREREKLLLKDEGAGGLHGLLVGRDHIPGRRVMLLNLEGNFRNAFARCDLLCNLGKLFLCLFEKVLSECE